MSGLDDRRVNRTVGLAGPLVGYTALALLVFLPAWRDPLHTVIGYSGDAQQTIWFLSWTPWAISHGVDPFLTSQLNSPAGVNLMWDSWAPLLGLVLWPVTVTGGPVLAYNVLITGGIALSAWCAYLAIRRYVAGGAAVVGGLAYGFGPFLMNQAHGHAKVTFAVLPPLLFIIFDEICVRQRRSPRVLGAVLGIVLGAQVFVLEEGVVLGGIAAALGMVALALLHGGRFASRRRYMLRAGSWSVAVFVLIVIGPLAVQLLGPGRVHGTVPGADIYVTDPVSLVVPTQLQWFSWGSLSADAQTFGGNPVETGSYLGIPLLVLLVVTTVLWWRRPIVAWAAVTGLALMVVSLGPHLHLAGSVTRLPLPYGLIQALSHVGSALPGRLFVYVEFLAAILVAVFVRELTVALEQFRRRVVAVVSGTLLLALTATTLLPETPFAATSLSVPAYFTTAQVQQLKPNAVVLVAPFVQDADLDDAMVWQAAADMRFRMPEGYFTRPSAQAQTRANGPEPSVTSRTMRSIATTGKPAALTPQLRRAVHSDLVRWNVSAVVVGPMPHQDVMKRFFSELLSKPAQRHGEVFVWLL